MHFTANPPIYEGGGMRLARTIAIIVALAFTTSTAALAATVMAGTYKGRSSDGIPVKVKVVKGGNSGSFYYCHAHISFTIANGAFTVKSPSISATGKFHGKKVTGTIGPSSCAGNSSTYKLKHG